MKKLLVVALVVGIAATLVNDVGKYLSALNTLDIGTKEVVSKAASAARKERDRKQPGGRAAMGAAQERGITVYGYQVVGNEIEVWTLDEVEGTWVAGPFLAWQAGKPLATPLQITEHDSAFIQ